MGIIIAPAPSTASAPSTSSGAFKQIVRTSGSLTAATGSSFAELSSALRITLNAAVNDVIQYGVNFLAQPNGGELIFDGWITSNATPHGFVGGTRGPGGMFSSSGNVPISGSVLSPALVSGDLSAGQVTVSLAFTNNGTGSATILATATYSLQVWARNLGPAAP